MQLIKVVLAAISAGTALAGHVALAPLGLVEERRVDVVGDLSSTITTLKSTIENDLAQIDLLAEDGRISGPEIPKLMNLLHPVASHLAEALPTVIGITAQTPDELSEEDVDALAVVSTDLQDILDDIVATFGKIVGVIEQVLLGTVGPLLSVIVGILSPLIDAVIGFLLGQSEGLPGLIYDGLATALNIATEILKAIIGAT